MYGIRSQFFFSSIRRHTRCALVTGVQTCALPIFRSANPNTSRPFILGRGEAGRSYGEFFAETGRYANALRALRVTIGDRVAVQVEKSVPALSLYLACQRLGAIFLPLNTEIGRAHV